MNFKVKTSKAACWFITSLVAGCLLNLFLVQTSVAQVRRFVTPGGTGSGTGWNDAGSLKAMINASATGDEVWVMQGNYQPVAGTAFSMKAGVKIYGSFSGTESVLSDRIIGTATTDSSRLIGNGNGVIINSNNGLDPTALLDGFFITGGFAAHGGGMYNLNSSPTIKHCIFSGNIAGQASFGSEANGGGMYNSGATVTISDCVFRGNKAGINGIQGIGGAICNEGAAAIINNCVFSGNNAGGNTIKMGGAIAATGDLQMVNCIFIGNIAGRGGAVYSSPATSITSNIINCSFSGNSDAVFFEGLGNLNIANSIIWGNNIGINNNIAQSGKAVASYCIVQGGYAGINNLNINPLFVSQPNVSINATGDLRLQPASAAIDKGNNSNFPSNIHTDLDGQPRLYNGLTDIGAYEYQASPIVPGLAVNNRSATMPVAANTTTTFLTDANGLIATITGDATATSVAGNVTAKVWIEPSVPTLNNQPYVARHYEITPPVSTATASVTLYFTQQDFIDFNNAAGSALKLPVNPLDAENYKANLRIAKYSLNSNDGTGLMNTYTNGVTMIDPDDAAITWNGSYWIISFPVIGFSGFFVQTSQAALPVKWMSSNAQISPQGNAVISWKVKEQNVAAYDIQKSTDGINFITKGSVVSVGDGENSYGFSETGIFSGIAYYRILQTDKGGKIGYSSILQLQNSTAAKATVSIYPNPSNETTVLSIISPTAEKIEYRLLDNKGTLLQQRQIQIKAGTNIIPFASGRYPAGLYYLEIKGAKINQLMRILK